MEAVLAKLNPEISSVILYELADNTAATGGWELTGYNMLESTSGGVVNIRAQYGGSGYYLTVKEFNVTALSKLVYSCGMGGVGTPEVVLVQNDTVVASGLIDMATATPTVPQTLDISNVKGSCRIGLKLQTYSNNILNAYMAYMALE